jgi:hypothetical protein
MINWWAVIVAAIVMFVIGSVWFTVLFGKQWRRMMGVPEGTQPEGFARAIAIGFIATLVEAYILAWFVWNAGPLQPDLGGGVEVGLLAWVGFVATLLIPSILYERRNPMIIVINGAYQLIGLVVMGAIIGWWR